ncbi:hypothetical protein [Spartinivicinus ruber]|uniref:hypothetical protein n=1 Tax=Spartinivicinus ruber TaxID=2683272 RepID=UPI0013D21B14|nr:hypothetical protein [Spartinivicinus ruber]
MSRIPNVKGDIPLLKRAYSKNVAMGERAVASDFEMTIKGYEDLTVLVRTAQLPEISRGDPVEDFGLYGQGFQQYGAVKRDGDITVNIVELKTGLVQDTLFEIIEKKEYVTIEMVLVGEGQKRRGWQLEDCILKADPGELDTSNRVGTVQIPVTIHYNWCERL